MTASRRQSMKTPDMTVTVRPLRDDEIRLYRDIHERAVRGIAGSHYSQDDIEGWVVPPTEENLRRLTLDADREIRLVAELNGRPAGIGALAPEESELLAVYVSPESTRHGCGSALVGLSLMALEVEESVSARFRRRSGWRRYLMMDALLGRRLAERLGLKVGAGLAFYGHGAGIGFSAKFLAVVPLGRV